MPASRRGHGALLIANRGEIAVRIARAACDVGLRTVGVYSSADREDRHVGLVDKAVCIGPEAARDSYLRSDALLHVAEQTGCVAVHPGYGFLAEDSAFAKAVCDAGLAWVGPPSEAIAVMGDKASARAAAAAAGVPVVPGSAAVIADADEVAAFGADYGYPLLLKARAGGGGKGMRVVSEPAQVHGALDLASREAMGAFGDDGIYVERLLPRVRHVEVQVLGDADGRVIALGCRDCSVQRRHQKVVEEAPAALPATTVAAMERAAVTLAESCGYRNAGTVEFLVDADSGEYFFIEMNTRIQVEHPVTEEVTGVDLVASQLRIALGERFDSSTLPHGQRHAIEFRITAEDPDNNFAPSPGKITTFDLPGGPGVRCDTHLGTGSVVPPYYDSLMAKLIVSGRHRAEAIARSRRALDEFTVGGVASSIDFHRWLLDQPEFVAGTHTTSFLSDRQYTGQEAAS